MFSHKMFGEFDLPFKETISTMMIFVISCSPAIFAKLQTIFDPTAEKPAAPAFTHSHNL